jgi:hypothetical protein
MPEVRGQKDREKREEGGGQMSEDSDQEKAEEQSRRMEG